MEKLREKVNVDSWLFDLDLDLDVTYWALVDVASVCCVGSLWETCALNCGYWLVRFVFSAVAERDLQQEMPTMKGAGKDVVGVLAMLNKEAKEMQHRSSQRLQNRKEKEAESFIQNLVSSSSSNVEEVVPPTPSKCTCTDSV